MRSNEPCEVNVKSGVVLALAVTMTAAGRGRADAGPAAADQLRRHEQISVFEGTLVGAVKMAAPRASPRTCRPHTSNANLFTGDARAKGFILDGYGVFVYVEIPALDLTLSVDGRSTRARAQRKAEPVPGQQIVPRYERPELQTRHPPTARVLRASRTRARSIVTT